MTASIQTPADLTNLALRRIGYRLRVASLYDGSLAAKQVLDIYAQTRDALLRDVQYDWGFAQRSLAMTLLKSAPAGGYVPPVAWDPATNPALPWLFEYAYPDDCIDVRSVNHTPIFIPDLDPVDYPYSIDNDNGYTPARRVILCNVPNAILVYVGQVTDPKTWPTDFVEALADAIAVRVKPTLMPPLNPQDVAAAELQKTSAERKRG